MITDLSVVTTASFYRQKKAVSKARVEELFTRLRAAHSTKSSRNIFRHTREQAGNSRWSAICFKYESSPSFLLSTTAVKEELCGYLLLVEYRGYVAVFNARLALPSSFKSEYLASVATRNVEAAVAKQNAVFQKVRLRNMSISPFALQRKTLEARDLTNVIGPSGSRRYAPQGYTVEVDGKSTTATPSTGRIAVRSDRVGLDDLISFAEGVIDELDANVADVSPFIKTFARPMSLEEALKQAQPTTLSIDTLLITEAVIGDNPAFRLVRNTDAGITQLSESDFKSLIETLGQNFEIHGNEKIRDVRIADHDEKAAPISLNKSRIALRSLDMAMDIEVENTSHPLGVDDDRRSLRDFLDDTNALIVLFTDITLAYIGGEIFRDETLKDGGHDLLRYLQSEPALTAVVDEKGAFNETQDAFDRNSTFGMIVQAIAAKDQILICDDLGDEWADFIGVRTDNGVSQVIFYHGKHGDLSLGGSAFHVSVGQAIKNLGNMMFPSERMQKKVAGWKLAYISGKGDQTQIARIIRGNATTLDADLAQTRSNPDTIRRAIIVTSSLSKADVSNALKKAQGGTAPKPSFVQLYWLLQSFFSACTEVGATGLIVCRP